MRHTHRLKSKPLQYAPYAQKWIGGTFKLFEYNITHTNE